MEDLAAAIRDLLKQRSGKKSAEAVRRFAETLDEEQWQFVLDGAYWSESASRSGVLAPCDDWFEKGRMSKSECLHFTLLCSLAPASVTCDALMHAESVEFDGRPATCALYEKVRQIDLLLCSMSNLPQLLASEALARTKQLVIVEEGAGDLWLKPKKGASIAPIDGSGLERFPMLHVGVWHPDGLRLIPHVRAMTLSSFKGGWPERVDVSSESLVYLHIKYSHPTCRLDTPNLRYLSGSRGQYEAQGLLSLRYLGLPSCVSMLRDNAPSLLELQVKLETLGSPSLEHWPVMPSLRKLALWVGTAGVTHLGRLAEIAPNLRELYLLGAGRSLPLPLEDLPVMPDVEVVSLSQQSHEGYSIFSSRFPNVRVVRIESCNRGDGQTLARLRRLQAVYACGTHDERPAGLSDCSASFFTDRASMQQGPRPLLPTVEECLR